MAGVRFDVARQLGKDLGVEVQFHELSWEQLIPALEVGKVDMVISGMTITTARNLRVNFTIPYSNTSIRILANKKLAGHFTQLQAFNRHSVTLAVRTGSEVVRVAEKVLPKANLSLFKDEASMVEAVRSGKVTAMLSASPLPEFMLELYPKELAMPVTDILERFSEGFAVRKQQDVDSLNVLNNWILQKLNNGWLQARHDEWFTSTDWRVDDKK